MSNELRRLIVALVREALREVPAPERPSVVQHSEVYVMALKAKVTLGEPKASDVEKRKLHVEVNGADTVTELPATAREHFFLVERNATVAVWLTDVDGSGNESAPSGRAEFTAVDTIPPGPPDAPMVEIVGEE